MTSPVEGSIEAVDVLAGLLVLHDLEPGIGRQLFLIRLFDSRLHHSIR
jgi:hypothetical protein